MITVDVDEIVSMNCDLVCTKHFDCKFMKEFGRKDTCFNSFPFGQPQDFDGQPRFISLLYLGICRTKENNRTFGI